LSLRTHAATGCVGVILGAVVVSLWGQRSLVTESPAGWSAAGEPRLATHVDAAALEPSIRRVVREELARHTSLWAAAPVEPAIATKATEAASPDVVAQVARADAVLAAAAARLTWTEVDAREFRSAIAGLPPTQRQELVLKFAQAVNDQRIRLETGETPF
jgi:hypothetical protein